MSPAIALLKRATAPALPAPRASAPAVPSAMRTVRILTSGKALSPRPVPVPSPRPARWADVQNVLRRRGLLATPGSPAAVPSNTPANVQVGDRNIRLSGRAMDVVSSRSYPEQAARNRRAWLERFRRTRLGSALESLVTNSTADERREARLKDARAAESTYRDAVSRGRNPSINAGNRSELLDWYYRRRLGLHKYGSLHGRARTRPRASASCRRAR